MGMSIWIPERDLLRLAILGKLMEELGELQAICARCLIQGIDENDPDTGTLNRDELGKECADVLAMIDIAMRKLPLDVDPDRINRKIAMKEEWHALIPTSNGGGHGKRRTD